MNTMRTAKSDTSFRFCSSGRISAPSEQRYPVRLSHWLPLQLVVALVLCAGISSSSYAQADDQQQKLESLLRRLPAADANNDGKLSREEAKVYNAAHPELRRNRSTDGKGNEREAKLVDDAVLELYEPGEFEGVKYRLLKPIDLTKNPDEKYPLILSLHGAAGTGHDNVRNLREWNTVMARPITALRTFTMGVLLLTSHLTQ